MDVRVGFPAKQPSSDWRRFGWEHFLGFFQPQRKHFSLQVILPKAHGGPFLPTGHPSGHILGSSTSTLVPQPSTCIHIHAHFFLYAWPLWEIDDLPVDVKVNQSGSCCSGGLHPGGWTSNHRVLYKATEETLAFPSPHKYPGTNTIKVNFGLYQNYLNLYISSRKYKQLL